MLQLCDSAKPSATLLAVQTNITLLIATRNDHKVGEIRAILGEQFRYLTLKDFPDAPPVIEDADTFAGNATKKAVELAHWLGEVRSAESEVRMRAMCSP